MRSSATFAITRTVVGRIFGSPLGALALLGALAGGPLMTVVAPLGIRRHSSTISGWTYEFAFMAGAVGVALATATRKRLDPLFEISASRPTALTDAWIAVACGILFAGAALLPAFPFVRASDLGLARILPVLAVGAAWSALALRLLPGAESAAWSVAVGTALLPALLPTTHLLLRGTAAAAGLVLGAALVDHPLARQR